MRIGSPTPADLERWATMGPEPVELALDGWERDEPWDGASPNERWLRLTRGPRTITLTRWWDRPLYPGQPMVVESRREVEVAGATHELLTTAKDRGENRDAQVLFLRDRDYVVRIVFEGCTPEEVDACLPAIRLAR